MAGEVSRTNGLWDDPGRYGDRPAGQDRATPVDPIASHNAVHRTRAMLVTVIGWNLLDVGQMRRLRAELEQAVARARTHRKRRSANWPQSGTTKPTGPNSYSRTAGPQAAIAILHPKILPPRPRRFGLLRINPTSDLLRLHRSRLDLCMNCSINLNICLDELASFS